MKRDSRKVIFVCEHGAGKSVVAAAWFNRIARDRNLDWEASCRGMNPDDSVSLPTKEGLDDDNLFDPKLKPQKLSEADIANAEKIIHFTRLSEDAGKMDKTEDWTSLPNLESGYKARRDTLIRKINEFFDTMEKK